MHDIDFLSKFYNFTMEFNPHKAYYETIQEFIEPFDHMKEDIRDELEKCIQSDKLWTLQVYPITPISFYWMAASTIERLLEIARETLKDEKGIQ